MYDASATLAGVTAHVGTGQSQVFTQDTDSNVSSGTSPLTDFPFTFNVIFVIYLSLIFISRRAFSRPKPVKRPNSREVLMIFNNLLQCPPNT